MKTFSHEPHEPQQGKTYKIISPSRLLHDKFGKNMVIRIIGKAQEIYGDDFMNQSYEGVCRFYVTRLNEIPDSSGEVYLGKIGLNDCLIHVSEIDSVEEVDLETESY